MKYVCLMVMGICLGLIWLRADHNHDRWTMIFVGASMIATVGYIFAVNQ